MSYAEWGVSFWKRLINVNSNVERDFAENRLTNLVVETEYLLFQNSVLKKCLLWEEMLAREGQRKTGRERVREREREGENENPKQAPCCQCRA